MKDGELKKRIDEIQIQKIIDTESQFTGEVYQVLDEMAKDLGLNHLWKKETLERMAKDGCYTISEKQSIELSLKLIKWFGEHKPEPKKEGKRVKIECFIGTLPDDPHR